MPVASLPWMESVDAKIERAKHHLSDLTRALGDLSRHHAPEMILKESGRDVWLVAYYTEPHAGFSHSAVFGDSPLHKRVDEGIQGGAQVVEE